MQHVILYYYDEKVTSAWSKDLEHSVMAKLGGQMKRLGRQSKRGPPTRLLSSMAVTTLCN
jgi:hypothetical protein